MKRYDLEQGTRDTHCGCMVEHPEGEWVRFEDAAAEVERCQRNHGETSVCLVRANQEVQRLKQAIADDCDHYKLEREVKTYRDAANYWWINYHRILPGSEGRIPQPSSSDPAEDRAIIAMGQRERERDRLQAIAQIVVDSAIAGGRGFDERQLYVAWRLCVELRIKRSDEVESTTRPIPDNPSG